MKKEGKDKLVEHRQYINRHGRGDMQCRSKPYKNMKSKTPKPGSPRK